jgi:osmotically-inducible protein OsmY
MSQDSQLQQSVLAAFKWEPSVSAGHIGVTANDGVITLSGHVGSYAEKHAAEVAARQVRGVRAVAEEIVVSLPSGTRRSDEDIAAAAITRLAWNVSVPVDAVQLKVEKGWVTLTGQVDRWYQRNAAEHDVRPLLGVVGVTNRVAIKPVVDTGCLSDDIVHALHRSWFFDPTTIQVHANGGRIVLSGTARSITERQVAAATAWAAPGATSVENNIVVV